MRINPFRAKIWAVICLIGLVIYVLPSLPHLWTKMIFTLFFIIWALFFYFRKVRLNTELVTDGVWWIPYFLLIGLGVLSFSENYRILLSETGWENLIKCAFLLVICAILFFGEWPPWLDKNKNLLSKGRRIFLAYIFFVLGLGVWAYSAICVLNAAADYSVATLHDSPVLAKAAFGHKYAQDTQYIIVLGPLSKQDKPYSFLVTAQEFQRIHTGTTHVRVWTKQGFFHHEWVASLKVMDQ